MRINSHSASEKRITCSLSPLMLYLLCLCVSLFVPFSPPLSPCPTQPSSSAPHTEQHSDGQHHNQHHNHSHNQQQEQQEEGGSGNGSSNGSSGSPEEALRREISELQQALMDKFRGVRQRLKEGGGQLISGAGRERGGVMGGIYDNKYICTYACTLCRLCISWPLMSHVSCLMSATIACCHCLTGSALLGQQGGVWRAVSLVARGGGRGGAEVRGVREQGGQVSSE